jgi:hypothetical protein
MSQLNVNIFINTVDHNKTNKRYAPYYLLRSIINTSTIEADRYIRIFNRRIIFIFHTSVIRAFKAIAARSELKMIV